MDSIDAWLYINLDTRPDRRALVEAELDKLGVEPQKRFRIQAERSDFPLRGCCESHIKALEFALSQGWKRVAILEDDILFFDAERVKATFDALPPCDVFLPSMGKTDRCVVPYNTQFVRVLRSQTTSSYVISKDYIPVLLENFKESYCKFHSDKVKYALDIFWTTLQPKGVWLSTERPLARQRPGWSDMSNQFLDYGC